jgi:hypothetical protein
VERISMPWSLDVMFLVEALLYTSGLVKLPKSGGTVIFCYHGSNRSAGLSNVDLAIFAMDAVHTWNLQFQVIFQRAKKPILLILCLDSILLIWFKVIWMYSGKVTEVGISFGLVGGPH